MNAVNKKYGMFVGAVMLAALPIQANAAAVTDSMIAIDDGQLWTLDHDTVTPATDPFTIGATWQSNNQLTVDENYSFTASNGLVIGGSYTWNNILNIQENATVTVIGDLIHGTGVSGGDRINVVGNGATLLISGNLDMSNGYNAVNNTLELSDGGIAVADGDFTLYNSYAYGNSWLELGGGALFLEGDKTADFAYGETILSSIKVWDEVTQQYERVANYYYDGNITWTATQYLDYLAVDYIADAAQAATLGYSDDFVGYTVLRDVNPVPEPGTVFLLGAGLVGLIGSRVRKKRMI